MYKCKSGHALKIHDTKYSLKTINSNKYINYNFKFNTFNTFLIFILHNLYFTLYSINI